MKHLVGSGQNGICTTVSFMSMSTMENIHFALHFARRIRIRTSERAAEEPLGLLVDLLKDFGKDYRYILDGSVIGASDLYQR